MMKTTSSLLLSLHLCLVQAAQLRQRRYLQEDEGENNNGDYNGSYSKYDEYKAELSYKWNTAKYQVEEDLNGMWETTPSEWGDEYWEVFVGIIGVALCLTFCMMIICCTPCCCSDYADENPRYVATQEELDARKRMKEPILNTEENTEERTPSHRSTPRRGSGSKAQRTADPPPTQATSRTKRRSTEDPPIKSKIPRQRRRRTLWEETVIVWKDFFRNGLYVPDDTMSHYTREAREEQRRRRSRSAARRKRSSSRNKRRGEMV